MLEIPYCRNDDDLHYCQRGATLSLSVISIINYLVIYFLKKCTFIGDSIMQKCHDRVT